MRVKVNKFYIYRAVGLDVFDSRTDLKDGDLVQVVNLPGCPRANTMGHCHVKKDGHFAGLVLTVPRGAPHSFIFSTLSDF